MSKTYKFSVADQLEHRRLNTINRTTGKPAKRVIHHRERRALRADDLAAAREAITNLTPSYQP